MNHAVEQRRQVVAAVARPTLNGAAQIGMELLEGRLADLSGSNVERL